MQTKQPTTSDHMKHPSQEQWMDYLYGELHQTQRTDLAAHLKSCPSCAAQVARWGGVQERLDEWQLPETTKRSWRIPGPVRWAMAAAFLIAALGIGFGAGRASGTKALRGEMQVALQKAYQDNQLLLTAMQRLDAARQAEILALRKDLETVAVNAEQEFMQLAALSQANPNPEQE